MQSEELPDADGDPLRVCLLGEDLIMFRDSQGRIGLLANSCPHRGASLFYERNEEGGVRCVYHGWKYDATGPVPGHALGTAESNFKDKKTRSAPTRASRRRG